MGGGFQGLQARILQSVPSLIYVFQLACDTTQTSRYKCSLCKFSGSRSYYPSSISIQLTGALLQLFHCAQTVPIFLILDLKGIKVSILAYKLHIDLPGSVISSPSGRFSGFCRHQGCVLCMHILIFSSPFSFPRET